MINDSHANELRCRSELIHQPGFLLAKGWQLAWGIASAQFEDLDLTPQQLGILHCVARLGTVTQRDLSEAMVIDGATLTGLVSRLERMELISRHREEEDRRLVTLALTPHGAELMAVVHERSALINATFQERLGSDGVAQLCDLLRRFLGWEGVAATATAAAPPQPAEVPSAAGP
ncbi:MAG TPA: MarR family transcriptional regulator [bacterium]|nr:MarR family transcriptional regulator [bacterium]